MYVDFGGMIKLLSANAFISEMSEGKNIKPTSNSPSSIFSFNVKWIAFLEYNQFVRHYVNLQFLILDVNFIV